MASLYVALIHHPVLDREGAIVTAAITNIDLHDMARSALTYDVKTLYVVHPIDAQRKLAERVRDHWVKGTGKDRIPDRAPPLERLAIVPSLEDAVIALGGRSAIEIWTTAARGKGAITTFAEARARLAVAEKPVLLLFGTGWGIAPSVIDDADVRVEPILGRNPSFNHLSVRAACAIALDRLAGP